MHILDAYHTFLTSISFLECSFLKYFSIKSFLQQVYIFIDSTICQQYIIAIIAVKKQESVGYIPYRFLLIYIISISSATGSRPSGSMGILPVWFRPDSRGACQLQ